MDIQKSIVAILDKKKKIIGTGFVAGENLILTCAHVVETATSHVVDPTTTDSNVEVIVRFALDGSEVLARVDVQNSSPGYEKDVALLRVDTLPQGAKPLPLAPAAGSAGHDFYAYGYAIVTNVQGIGARGKIVDIVDHGRLVQLTSQEPDHGMSGGPVLDEQRRMVIGMVTKGKGLLEKDQNLRNTQTTFATATDVIFGICHALKPSEIRPQHSPDTLADVQPRIDIRGGVNGEISITGDVTGSALTIGNENITNLINVTLIQKVADRISFPVALIDQKIDEEVDTLRKSRFFVEFNKIGSAVILAKKLINGELSGGTDIKRSRALAWCARVLSITEELNKAEEYLKLAKELGTSVEINIADAFILAQKGDKGTALSSLTRIDNPSASSAAFMIVVLHNDAQQAIDWLKTAGFTTSDLDADGKYSVLVHHLRLGNWEIAREQVGFLSEKDLDEVPILNHFVAITYLISAVPNDFRHTLIFNRLPFNAGNFPLASDKAGIDARWIAHNYFLKAAEIAKVLHLPTHARIDDEYALWLELKDPEKSNDGLKKLEARLFERKPNLHLVYLGFQFSIKLSPDLIEQEIERQNAQYGGTTEDIAIARFALASVQKTPYGVASYVEQHFEELVKFLDKKFLRSVQIEMFSQAGLPDRATEHLDVLKKDGISEIEENDLQRIISEAKGADPVVIRMEQFEKTKSLSDLMSLVDILVIRQDWGSICEYGQILFKQTLSLQHALLFAHSLNKTQKSEELLQFIKEHLDFLPQSRELQMFYCWALYCEGELLDARSELAKLSDNPDNPHYRNLQVHLGITLGDWASLSTFVASEWSHKDKRSHQDLIRAAQLALYIGSPHAKQLTFKAADMGSDDASILTAAYFLASGAGWEDDQRVFNWLEKAAALSGDNGPIQKMTLKDILDRKPEWDRRESQTWQMLSRGEIPMFLAAQFLNKSLIFLMLFPALANLLEDDARRRSIIPAYSGLRSPAFINASSVVGMDATTLLTLSYLGILDKTLDIFNTVYVPHSTLGWLFEEKQKAGFHQPSRIKDAHRIRGLIAIERLHEFVPSTTIPDSDLSDQVGDELAQLISDAEKVRQEDNRQHIVVRPSPVHRLTSLADYSSDEEADLTLHENVLSSCQAIVGKLRQKGAITEPEERKARAYLQLHEKPWPSQPEIADGAILYLDDLATTYFLHLGILEKLRSAGLKAIVSSQTVSEINQLIAYDGISRDVNEAIENIRVSINSRIELGKIKVSRLRNISGRDGQSVSGHPTVDVIGLTKDCDAIIADDRFVNQYLKLGDRGVEAPIFSTLDIIDMLASSGSITNEDRLEYKTRLRRAGYCFVPVSEDELTIHLSLSPVKDGNVIETAELKAIREGILQVRMSSWLQFPKEGLWLDAYIDVFIRVLRSLWKANGDFSSIRARSNWIMSQIEERGWVHRLDSESADNLIKTGTGRYILRFLKPFIDLSKDAQDEYWNWVDERILDPIKKQNLSLYSEIVNFYRTQIIAEMKMPEMIRELINNSMYVKSKLAQETLKLIPPLIRESLLDDSSFLEEYGLGVNIDLALGNSGISVRQSKLFNAVRKVLSSNSEKTVSDTNGKKWKLSNASKDGELVLVLSRGKKRLPLPDFSALSPDNRTRLMYLDESASDVNLPPAIRDKWHSILAERALEDDEVNDLLSEFHDTPIEQSRAIHTEAMMRKIEISSLVPHSRRYFERLIGIYDGSRFIRDYSAGIGRALFNQLSEWRPYDGFLSGLLLSSHSSITNEIGIDRLNNDELVSAFDFLDKHGDRISQLGAIEVGLRILPLKPDIEPAVIRLIKQIRDDNVDGQASGFKLLSALFILVDGELSKTRLLSTEPPFYRRLATLSQAALIHRQLMKSVSDVNHFYKWASDNQGEQFYMQSFADMRLEPRWSPDFAVASQMKADFFGRIILAAKTYEKNIKSSEIFDLVLANKPESLCFLDNSLRPFLPGPLEGSDLLQNNLPPEIAKIIETQLGSEKIEPLSFIALVNAALIFRVDAEQAELAAKVLKLGNYRLAKVEDKEQLLAILNGLAMVAGVTRNDALANELRILTRRYRHDSQYTLSNEEALRICLVASASHADLNGWRDFLGDWLTELAFSDLDGDDGKMLLSRLHYLFQLVPELWVSCGRADAALTAYVSLSTS